ncbi:MAG: transporter substrate-binding domain-containing protein [Colwelliaceae bacterium]|nr:transporter substrate-binding domain-containing protein [Colwelliaceae bacterium]
MRISTFPFIALLLIAPLQASSQEISVGLEPFPPFINEDGTGYAIDMLSALSKQSDLRFNFHLMTWARAKRELKAQRLEMIGISPKNNETADYYQYAKELNWSFNATVDLFSKNKASLDLDTLPNQSIGTLIGNADFFAEISQIPRNKFIEISSLNQLVKMMNKGRIHTVIFERISMMSTIQKLNLINIHYKKLMTIPATFAVKNTIEGSLLKEKLDKLISKESIATYQKKLTTYSQLPSFGVVSLSQ